jgi:molybdate transport system ATP-binding protein
VSLTQSQPIRLDVSLNCGPGELLALVGPSGSGKSTVLRAIAGIHQPDSGVVACDGITWLDTHRRVRLSPQQRRVGFVFQHYALFPHMSSLDNVAAAVGHRPPSQRRERARELLDLVNMNGLEARRPGQLSGGQRQRVALARALARDPVVLLLDEPFSAVDQMTRHRLRRELAQLRQGLNLPIVLVTHDLDEAQILADRMSLLYRGCTVQEGSVNEVMSRPVNAEAARLLDHRNVFRARVVSHEPDARRSWLQWGGSRIECGHVPEVAAGEEVEWLIPQSGVVLHRRDRPSRGEHENPVHGSVRDAVILGDEMQVSMAVADEEHPLTFSVSLHVARRNGVETGEPITVSLLSEGIHVMPRGGGSN